MPRYRFSDFVVSPRQRMLLQGGRERPLIPRYFDLLVFLVELRHEAVHRRDIFVAEVTSRSQRTIALGCGAAAGGGLVGVAVQWLGRWSLAVLVGVHVVGLSQRGGRQPDARTLAAGVPRGTGRPALP